MDLFAERKAGARQPDLFGGPAQVPARSPLPVEEMADDAIIAAIPDAGMADAPPLAAEAGRRRLVAAVPALERLCRRLTGYGRVRLVPEQAGALDALAAIGGGAAAEAVARLLEGGAFQGPTRRNAVGVAARLGSRLPAEAIAGLLRDPEPAVRADACRCVRGGAMVIALLVDLLDDLNAPVSMAAACALGRLGRAEGRAPLLRLLASAPTEEVVEALANVADQDCLAPLGRAARLGGALGQAALDALDGLDDPRAARLAAMARGAEVTR